MVEVRCSNDFTLMHIVNTVPCPSIAAVFVMATAAFYDVANCQVNARDPDDFLQGSGTKLVLELHRVACSIAL